MAKEADDLLEEAREAFELARDTEEDNRRDALADFRFARLGEQWDPKLIKRRELDARPCLTINRLPSFIRQVVNDARQNKPSIKVHPVDSSGDIETAKIYDGLIRHIEAQSNADVAYDTAAEHAVTGGFGYFRMNIDYARDDVFDKDILIERVANPFTVYGDPHSAAADSSDWDVAFITDTIPTDAFELKYPKAEAVDWEADFRELGAPWFEDERVLICEWWKREEIAKPILMLSDGTVIDRERFEAEAEMFAAAGVQVVRERVIRSYKVTQRLMTGAEILETHEWAGRYIPIVPVYGDEVNVEGKRHLRSLIRDAKDAQRMFNYWRTAASELVALAPKAPFVGPEEAFKGEDADKWANANTASYPYIGYRGAVAPQRQPFAGVPAGAIQEALNASDDMKAIIGMYDASLGARSNETSGKAIMARQREGDVATFHFLDNLTRAIRHGGKILLDLIPLVYGSERIVRVLGVDGTVETARLGQKATLQDGTRVYDLAAGKYDLAVSAGPSFTTRREEAATQMTEMIRSFPQAAPLLGDLLAKNLDWPGADEIAERLQSLLPPQLRKQAKPGDPKATEMLVGELQGQLSQAQQQMQAMQPDVLKVQADMKKAEADHALRKYEIDSDAAIAREKLAAEQQMNREKLAAEFAAKREGEQIRGAVAQQGQVRQEMHDMRMARMVRPKGADGEEGEGATDGGLDPFAEMAQGLGAVGQGMTAMGGSIGAGLTALSQQVAMATELIVAAVERPKRIVKDKQGRPVGVEPARPGELN